jgi:hypothetical protein
MSRRHLTTALVAGLLVLDSRAEATPTDHVITRPDEALIYPQLTVDGNGKEQRKQPASRSNAAALKRQAKKRQRARARGRK